MPNQITADGLETKTEQELVEEYTEDFQEIYGDDINLDSDTPDGQMMHNFIQSILDMEELLTNINANFDPDQATGRILDQRVAINGIQRQAGTKTVTNITIVTSQALNLYGLDQEVEDVYTVADNAGNEWELITSRIIGSGGTYIYAFSAKNPGAVLTTPNTITIPVTIVLGITSINNPTTYTTLGINEESDAALKVRRQQSVSLASQGYLAGLLAALQNINGVTFVGIEENHTGGTVGGIPSHSIWVIVAGTGEPEEIANAIYRKRNAGCGMKGSESYEVDQPDGSTFEVFWDEVVAENLFIKATLTSLDGVNAPNIAAIRPGLVTSFVPGVNDQVNINDLATAIQAIDDNSLVTFPSQGFCLTVGGSYTNTLSPSAPNKQFAVTEAKIILLPMIISPVTVTVVHGEQQQFTGYGGYGAYVYTIHTNNSGGSINASTGLYTAGATPSTDTVRCTDSLGNFVAATVTVT